MNLVDYINDLSCFQIVVVAGAPGNGKTYLVDEMKVSEDLELAHFHCTHAPTLSMAASFPSFFTRQLPLISTLKASPHVFVIDDYCSDTPMGSFSPESLRTFTKDLATVCTTHLQEHPNVCSVLVSNQPWTIPFDLLPSGVQLRKVNVSFPTEEQRFDLISTGLRSDGASGEQLSTSFLRRIAAENLDGRTFSDVSAVVRHALMQPIRRLPSLADLNNVDDPLANAPDPEITEQDVLGAIEACPKSISSTEYTKYYV